MDSRSNHVYIGNIPQALNEEGLLNWLQRLLPEFFDDPVQRGRATAAIWRIPAGFPNAPPKCFAVVSGVDLDFDELMEAVQATRPRINGFTLVFKKDRGEPRDEMGRRIGHIVVEEVRRLHYLQQQGVRRVELRTVHNFRHRIFPFFDGKPRLYLRTPYLRNNDIGASHISNRLTSRAMAVFPTSLDALDGLLRHNRRRAASRNAVIIFQDENGRDCPVNFGQHLGPNGEHINYSRIQQEVGYVPWRYIRRDVIHCGFYRDLDAPCYNCQTNYEILGLSANLDWAAGQCTCNYTLPTYEEGAAVHLEREQFTRLIFSPACDLQPPSWHPYYVPLKPWYDSAIELQRALLPMIMREKNDNISNVRVPTARNVEITELRRTGNANIDGIDYHVYGAHLNSFMTDIWRQSLLLRFDEFEVALLLESDVFDEPRPAPVVRRCALRDVYMEDDPETLTTIIHGSIFIEENLRHVAGTTCTIIAQLNVKQFDLVRAVLTMWSNGTLDSMMLQYALQPMAPLPMPPVDSSDMYQPFIQHGLRNIRGALNAQQITALDNALMNNVSMISGGPGTGKTGVGAAIAIASLIHHRSPTRKVVIVVPTISSAEAIMSCLAQTMEGFFTKRFPFTVLRAVGKSRGMMMLRNEEQNGHPRSSVYLHDKINEMIRGSGDVDLINTHQAILDGMGGFQSRDALNHWEIRVSMFRDLIINRHRLQLWTLDAALEDGFLDTFWFNGLLSTLIVDEAGYIPKFLMLPLLAMKNQRLVLIGDEHQLHMKLNSLTCKLGGLGISLLEWLSQCNRNIPIVTLNVQYRMPAQLCRMVSELTYEGRLMMPQGGNDGLSPRIAAALGLQPTQHLLIIDHQFREEIFGGRTNLQEVFIIEDLVTRFTNNEVPIESINILTFYEAQKRLLEQSPALQGCNVFSMNEMQGRGGRIVIVSMVRSGRNVIGCLKHYYIINFMLSRASELLVIVMNRTTYRNCAMQAVKMMMAKFNEVGAVYRTARRVD